MKRVTFYTRCHDCNVGDQSIKRFADLLKNVGITEYNWQEIASTKKN